MISSHGVYADDTIFGLISCNMFQHGYTNMSQQSGYVT